MYIEFILMALIPVITSIIATSTTVIPLYSDDGTEITDTLTKFNIDVSVKTFIVLVISTVPSLFVMFEVNIYCALVCITLTMIAYIDIKFTLIPNRFVLLLSLTVALYVVTDVYMSWFEISLRIGFAFFLFVALLVIAIFTNGSIGGADIKIMPIVIIALTTNQSLVFMVIIALFTLSTMLFMYATKNKDKGIPLIPYISVSMLVALLFGEQLNYLYEEKLLWFIHSFM